MRARTESTRRWLVVALLPGVTASVLAAASAARAGEDVPDWLKAAAALQAPAYGPAVEAVVLHAEERVVIEKDGRAVITCRSALRVLTREGASHAVARVDYNTDSGKVRDLRAWVLPPPGASKPRQLRNAVDAALDRDALYTEARTRAIIGTNEVVPGAVFGFEVVVEDRGLVKQYEWMFQDRLPALLSRCSVEAPPGWSVAAVTLNHPAIEPAAAEDGSAWELRDLPPIEDEPASPPLTAVVPRLAVTVSPPASGGTRASVGFQDWGAVSRWVSGLAESQAQPSPALAAKAQALAAGARTDRERVAAIARFVQAIRYVSIQMGTARGGGYTPRPAAEVLEKYYGDCKDKANLMKALLEGVGIQAHLVPIYLGDPDYVQESWPSPEQFNHCIIAIRVAETSDGPVIRHPSLGTLLFFDPTDPYVPLGDLPTVEQGSLALLVAGDAGGLVRAPLLASERNRMERAIEVALQKDGAIAGTVQERSFGQRAANERRYYGDLSRADYARSVERWIAGGVGDVKIAHIETQDDAATGRFTLDVSFDAKQYAQGMSPHLLTFRPLLIERREALVFSEPKRTLPIMLEADALEESVRIALPDGFAVEDPPAPVALDTDFGTYSLRYETGGGRLVVTRSLHVRGSRLPPGRYEEIRGFFDRIRAAERTPIVLAR